MTTDQAKFILQSFRPDGSDSSDPSFAEALAVASANRELGEWLARERAADAAFASVLSEAHIPSNLREDILSVLSGDNTDITIDSLDGEFIGALAQMTPPANLKSSILAAMDAQTIAVPEQKAEPNNVISMRHWLGAMSAAAALVVAALLAFGGPPEGPLSQSMAQAGTISYLNASFESSELDYKGETTGDILTYLQSNPQLTPSNIPSSLKDAKAVGCKILEISGKKASLICYNTEDFGMVHLVTFKSEDVMGDLCPFKDASGNCISCPTGQFSIASWMDENTASFLYSAAVTPARLSQVF